MFERLLAHREHIPPHRIWAFHSAAVWLEFPEYIHLKACADCREFFQICEKAENFGEALGIWLSDNDIDKAG